MIGAIIYMIVCLAIAGITVYSLWKVYQKAGRPGWQGIVPVYNFIVLMEIVKKPTWWAIIVIFVPIIGIYFLFQAFVPFAKAFGKDSGFAVGLTLLSPIFFAILAFSDDAKFIGVPDEPSVN